tara:strand:- start:431 stop:616 length:186 start_codon:yes stop_codon:yes gene_type:complete
MRQRARQKKTQGCCGRPHRDTWQNGGDNIGFSKRPKGVKRKKNLLNTNGRIHPESQKSEDK